GRQELAEVSGQVSWETGGGTPSGARVGLYQDANGNGTLEATDPVLSYFRVESDGTFSGSTLPGNYLVRAEVLDEARSSAQTLTVAATGATGVALSLPTPVQFDYEITDFDTGNPIPGKITVIGRHPAAPDQRLFDTFDRKAGVVRMVHAVRGSSSLGEMPDPAFSLPPGTYRVVATRGTEWSEASQVITVTSGQAPQTLDFALKRVIDTTGYVSSEYHVHQVGSPDSPVLNDDRVRSAAADGIELFSSNDHDFVTDLQPYVEAMSLTDVVRVIPGLEVTPFTYGHFNAWPIQPLPDTANGGAVDWARGMEGYAMIPDEIFSAMRGRGAELVQVNHPRATRGSLTDFMQFFDRAGLSFDFDNRIVDSDLLRQPVPNEWMRLPEVSLWSNAFNALEVWNGFSTTDANGDGVREISSLDIVLRDWFNFLTMGMRVTPIGSSDTHTMVKDPMGMPRTMVAVTDDSSAALSSGNIVDDVLDTLAARNGTPVDIVVTNGPFIQVTAVGTNGSAIGRVIDGSGGVTFDIVVTAPAWAQIDTIELFANETLEVGRAATQSTLQPRFCFTARTGLDEADTCALATGGARALTVTLEDLGDGFTRYHATAQITIAAADIDNRAGATGDDAWFVVRAYGTRAVFPVLLDGVISESTLDVLVSGTPTEQSAVLDGAGVPAMAFTAPIYVDFDGGGYRAVFLP
ncbi:MAG TPA: CehA/McbA family metallohydrolase, partial [Kofleriaceae bacterium]|nr:CehA/McbA family metallohydrolase [Kofleriaceae bacterium]